MANTLLIQGNPSLRNQIWRKVSSRLCEQSIIDIWIFAISNLNLHKKLSTFGYSNTNETVYFIEITGITYTKGKSKRNLNTKEKLNMCSLKSRHTSSTLDHNLSIAYLDSSLKTCSWCSNSASSSSLIPLSLFSTKKKHRSLFCTVVIRSPSVRHYRFAKLRNSNAPSNATMNGI